MMNETLTYRILSAKDTPAVSELVARVFDEFIAPEYSSEGVQEFYRCIQPHAFRVRAQANHFSLISLEQDKVVGMIYAVPIYKKLDFCRAGERQVENGIGFLPMVLQLPTQDDS